MGKLTSKLRRMRRAPSSFVLAPVRSLQWEQSSTCTSASDDVIVTLIEGRVDVTADRTATGADAGRAADLRRAGHGAAARSADLRRVSAWRSRKLEFRETRLAEAIAEANRYSRVRIELRDAALADARISGVFDAGRNDSLASALRAYSRADDRARRGG